MAMHGRRLRDWNRFQDRLSLPCVCGADRSEHGNGCGPCERTGCEAMQPVVQRRAGEPVTVEVAGRCVPGVVLADHGKRLAVAVPRKRGDSFERHVIVALRAQIGDRERRSDAFESFLLGMPR